MDKTLETTALESSDDAVLRILQQVGSVPIGELGQAMGVTATAVRQRLQRLMAAGLVERQIERRGEQPGRGRPNHQYQLTKKGIRKSANNFADLATVLWEEVRAVKEPEIRRGLLQRIATRMAGHYKSRISGESLGERMGSLASLMGERGLRFEVDHSSELPVLTALACPYPELAEQDRGVCSLEKMVLSEVLGETVKLEGCRLDGETCCTFAPTQ